MRCHFMTISFFCTLSSLEGARPVTKAVLPSGLNNGIRIRQLWPGLTKTFFSLLLLRLRRVRVVGLVRCPPPTPHFIFTALLQNVVYL